MTVYGGNVQLYDGNLMVKQGQVEIEGRLVIQNTSGGGLGNGANQIALNQDGTIRSREVRVDLQTIPDYVFEKDYNLMSLNELKAYIEKNTIINPEILTKKLALVV
jgi:hypothetical protein